MDIREDDNLFSGSAHEEEESRKTEDKNENNAPSQKTAPQTQPPGTRIIYQAPEKGVKREYTGFVPERSDTADSDVSQKTQTKGNSAQRKAYTGGHAFEQELKNKNAYPRKRAAEIKAEEKKVDEREIRRQRYAEYQKRQREMQTEDVILDDIDTLDVEDISIDTVRPVKKKTGAGEIVRRLVLAVSLVAIVVSLGVLLNQYIQYRENEKLEENLDSLIITDITDTTANTGEGDKDEPPEEVTTTRPLTIEEQWAVLKSENPDVFFPAGIQLKYAKFYAINQDFVGYLTIDELDIGLPVVQSQEEEYYMRRNIYKEKSKYGCPFVPSDNDMVNLDRNTVLYGHNMSDGSMFAPLNKYKTLEGYKTAPVIQFDTIYGTYKWKVIGAFITNASKKHDNGYVFPYNFTKLESDEEFMKYIEQVRERSLYDTGVDVISSDKILTLSTCTYDFDNARFVVVARLVRDGESTEVDTSQAKVNEKPRYPQEYYDKKKKKNPYKKAEKWYYYG